MGSSSPATAVDLREGGRQAAAAAGRGGGGGEGVGGGCEARGSC
jgi:hypothetical protein